MKLLKMKKVIFHADDFGYTLKSSNLIFNLFKKRKVNNFSVLINFLFNKKKLIKQLKNKKVFLHINLIEGKPISQMSKSNFLVDKNYNFLPLFLFLFNLFLKKIKKKEIYSEIEAQILFCQKKGLNIYGLDSHQHLHAISPVAECVAILAKKYRIKNVRSYKNVYNQTIIAKLKYLLLKLLAILSQLVFYNKLDYPITWKIKNKRKLIFLSWESKNFDFSILKKKPDFFEIVIHPGLPFDSSKDYLILFKKNEKA